MPTSVTVIPVPCCLVVRIWSTSSVNEATIKSVPLPEGFHTSDVEKFAALVERLPSTPLLSRTWALDVVVEGDEPRTPPRLIERSEELQVTAAQLGATARTLGSRQSKAPYCWRFSAPGIVGHAPGVDWADWVGATGAWASVAVALVLPYLKRPHAHEVKELDGEEYDGALTFAAQRLIRRHELTNDDVQVLRELRECRHVRGGDVYQFTFAVGEIVLPPIALQRIVGHPANTQRWRTVEAMPI